MPCLHIHVFISFSFLCLIFQVRRQLFSFSTSQFIMHFTVQWYCRGQEQMLCLFGKYTTQSLFYWKFSLSNQQQSPSEAHLEPSQRAMMKVFVKIGNGFQLQTFFAQKLHPWQKLYKFTVNHNAVALSTQSFLQKLFFFLSDAFAWSISLKKISSVQIWTLANGILSIGKTMSSKIWGVLGPSTFGNPFTFI